MGKAYLRLRRFCAWTVGIVFTISGILKLMDPVGTGLLMGEYFQFLHIGFMRRLGIASGMFFSFLETFTGIALVTGVWRKAAAVSASVLMALFTLLTILLAAFDPPMDCGCFGEVLHLTHLQSLLKNIVLDLLLVFAFVPWREFGEPRKIKYGSFALISLSCLLFGIYSALYLPLDDYTDYRPGAMLASSSKAQSSDGFSARYIYEKNGARRIISLEDELPDDSWTFVGVEEEIEEIIPSYPVLPITDNGAVADSLAAQGDVIAVSAYSARRLGKKKMEKIYGFMDMAESAGYRVLLLTLRPEAGSGGYGSDFRALVGLNRSNGGATLIRDGVIVKKWARRNLPDRDTLEELLTQDPMETTADSESRGKLPFQSFLLYSFAVLLLL